MSRSSSRVSSPASVSESICCFSTFAVAPGEDLAVGAEAAPIGELFADLQGPQNLPLGHRPDGHPPAVAGNGQPPIVRAQYRAGWVDGKEVPGYRSESGVSPQSTTETYVAMRPQLDSWRWAGVPFYIRTGKCLPVTVAEVLAELKKPPQAVFSADEVAHPNYLRFRVGPTVEMALSALNIPHGRGGAQAAVEFLAKSVPA